MADRYSPNQSKLAASTTSFFGALAVKMTCSIGSQHDREFSSGVLLKVSEPREPYSEEKLWSGSVRALLRQAISHIA